MVGSDRPESWREREREEKERDQRDRDMIDIAVVQQRRTT